MKFRAKTLLAKLEVTYGVDPTPTAADGIQTKNLSIQPYLGNMITRDLDRETLGAQVQINTNPHVEVSFEVELAGSGTAGTVPGYGRLLRACGFAETVVTTPASVTYKPKSDGFDSIALYYLQRNDAGGFQCQKITGCRGTVAFTVDRAGIPVMKFRFLGFYQRPTDIATIAVNRSAFIDPVYVSKENTVLTLGAYTARASAFNVDVANAIAVRSVTGDRSAVISNRNPTGSATVDAPKLADKNFFQSAESHNGVSLEAVKLTHGTVAGNIIEISAPKVQISTIAGADSDGELAYQLGMTFVPSTGDDELLITVK